MGSACILAAKMKVEALGTPHNQHGYVYFVWENEGRGGQNSPYLQQLYLFILLPPRPELLEVGLLQYLWLYNTVY